MFVMFFFTSSKLYAEIMMYILMLMFMQVDIQTKLIYSCPSFNHHHRIRFVIVICNLLKYPENITQVNMLTNKLHPCTLTSLAEDTSIYPDLRSKLASDLRRISR